jgi:hypothetical protein
MEDTRPRPRPGTARGAAGERVSSGRAGVDHDREARLLAVDVELPDGVELRRIAAEADVRAMSTMQEEVFHETLRRR